MSPGNRLRHQVKAQFPVGVGWLVKSEPKVRAIDELHHPDFGYPGSVGVIQGETQDEPGIFFNPVPAQCRETSAMHGDIFNPAVYGFFCLGEVGNILAIEEHVVGSLKIGGLAVKLAVLEAHWKNSGAGASDSDHRREGSSVLQAHRLDEPTANTSYFRRIVVFYENFLCLLVSHVSASGLSRSTGISVSQSHEFMHFVRKE